MTQTVANWPKVGEVSSAALIVVQHYRRNADRTEYTLCDDLREAADTFRETCDRLQCGPYHQHTGEWPRPNVAYGPVEGEPGGKYGSMGTYGVKVTLYVKDNRQPTWAEPGIDKAGRVYVQAFLGQSTTLKGFGYMSPRAERKGRDRYFRLPPGAIFGIGIGSVDPAEIADLIHIGGKLVRQEDLHSCFRRTREFPRHLTWDDPSGSCRYLAPVVWGDEPKIIKYE